MKNDIRDDGLKVMLRPGEDADRLIRRFTKGVRESRVIQEVIDRRHHLKTSEERRKKHSRAIFSKKLEKKS